MINFYPILQAIESKEQRIMAESLFASYGNAMYHIAFRILKNEAEAEDAVMKAAENICRHIRDFTALNERQTKLKISRIVKNAAIDIYRAQKRHPLSPHDEFLFSDGDSVSSAESEESRDFGSAEPYVTELKEKYRIILLMKYGEQMSNREIARILHIPESTVATRLARARETLKKKMEKDGLHP